ncbi:MAG TPA: hypothetical protein VLF39_04245 [Candidatus Saccharimonadales bacterium]|nr:hypothetical protein [Candidatus Saccharimonadales bacterium]
MKYFKTSLALILLLATSFVLLQSSQALAFNPFNRPTSGGATAKTLPVCQGSATASVACKSYSANPFAGNNGVIIKASLILSWIIGLASVAVILYSGFQFMNSRGDAQRVATARNTLLYAVVGLIVAVSAQATIAFALNHIL